MPRLLRTAIMIVAAMMGNAALLAGLIIAVSNVTTYGSVPADFLPANYTIAMIHEIDAQTKSQWIDVFPSLTQVPGMTGSTIGIINDGTEYSVEFYVSQETDIGAYAIEVSDESAMNYVGRHRDSVGQDPAYTMLSTLEHPSSWSYVRTVHLPKPHGLRQAIEHALLYGNSDAISLHHTQDATVIHREPSLRESDKSQEYAHVPNTVARISITQPKSTWHQIQQTVLKHHHLILEGIAKKYIAHWGTDISMEYDVLSLLTEPATIQVTASGGVMGILIEGSQKDTVTRDRILDRLHQSVIAMEPATTITKRILDKRFTATDIRHDPSQIHEQHDRVHNWVVRSTVNAHDNTIVTATNGSQFMIGTAREAVIQGIQSRISSPDRIQSAGSIHRESFEEWIFPLLPANDRETLLSGQENVIRWQAVLRGSLLEISLQK